MRQAPRKYRVELWLLRELLREVVREEIHAVLGREGKDVTRTPREGEVDEPRYVTVAEAARIGCVHVATIRGWIKAGHLGRYSAGSALRVKLDELHAFMARGLHSEGAANLERRAGEILAGRRR